MKLLFLRLQVYFDSIKEARREKVYKLDEVHLGFLSMMQACPPKANSSWTVLPSREIVQEVTKEA